MPLNKQEIEKFKARLEDLRGQISKAIKGTAEDIKSDTGSTKGLSQHQADEGTDDYQRNLSIDLGEQELTVLRQIDRSLEKMEEGTYGICDVSGDPIPLKRLEAIPYANMTVQAQEKVEKGQY
jgi:DnaK suppressor protein